MYAHKGGFDKIYLSDYNGQKHSHPFPHLFMSEHISSHDPVVEALKLEQDIATTLEHPVDASARKKLRAQMDEWMATVHDPEAAQEYREQLGDLSVETARQDILKQIAARFPGVAKDFGYDPNAALESHNQMAA